MISTDYLTMRNTTFLTQNHNIWQSVL